MGKLILHIGTEKTGSTTIQQTLAANQATMRNHGVAFLPLPATSSLLLAGTAARRPPQAMMTQMRQALRHFGKVIASSELYQSRLTTVKQIEAFRDLCMSLNPDGISVVLYLRRQAEIANSMIATAARTHRDREQSPLSPYVRNICDHRRTLEVWSRVFGRECIQARVFTPDRLCGNDLIEDFLEAIGFESTDLVERIPSQNEAMSWDGVLVVRAIHRELASRFPDINRQHRNQLGAKLCQRHVSPNYKQPKLMLHPAIWSLFDEEYEEINQWVKTEWLGESGGGSLFRRDLPAAATSPTLDKDAVEAAARDIIDQDSQFIGQWLEDK